MRCKYGTGLAWSQRGLNLSGMILQSSIEAPGVRNKENSKLCRDRGDHKNLGEELDERFQEIIGPLRQLKAQNESALDAAGEENPI